MMSSDQGNLSLQLKSYSRKQLIIWFRAFSIIETDYLIMAWNNTSLEKMGQNRRYFNYKATSLLPLADLLNHEFPKSKDNNESHVFQLVGQPGNLNFLLVGDIFKDKEIKMQYISDWFNSYN